MMTDGQLDPAASVLRRFGGGARVAELLGVNRSTVWRWTQPRNKGGTGGLIPLAYVESLAAIAASRNIAFDAHDVLPVSLRRQSAA